jgi:PAS domain S-box-containing protein
LSSHIGEPAMLAAGQITFRQLADAMPQMVWSTLPDGSHDYYNAQWYAFTGVPAGSTDGDGWNGMFHPDDQDRAWAVWSKCLATGEPYEIEYRLRHRSGEYRWTLGRALPVRDESGAIVRWVGTCTDIDHHKRTAEQNEVLSRELSHRIKNIFAVVNGLVALTARQFPAMKDLAGQLQARIASLGRAHDYVRPHSDRSAPHPGPQTLKVLLEQILGPYPALDEGRLVISGDDMLVDDRGATPIALVIHELATNSAKYGALSVPEGRIALIVTLADGRVRLTWQERGGPPIDRAPTDFGFGTRLSDISIKDQLGGTLTRAWDREGLTVEIEVADRRLSRT